MFNYLNKPAGVNNSDVSLDGIRALIPYKSVQCFENCNG
jgi:hypothetical protein